LSTSPEHEGSTQTVSSGHFLQEPLVPAHFPSVPHVVLSVTAHFDLGSTVPAATAEQVPTLPARLHFSQAESQRSPQQTPSAQNPLKQAASEAQGCPTISLHTPVACPCWTSHRALAAQSVSVAQAVLHVPAAVSHA
jgi:hypothetical protein